MKTNTKIFLAAAAAAGVTTLAGGPLFYLYNKNVRSVPPCNEFYEMSEFHTIGGTWLKENGWVAQRGFEKDSDGSWKPTHQCIVEKGQTLWNIADIQYSHLAPMVGADGGPENGYFKQAVIESIARENQIPFEDIDHIQIGQTLNLPYLTPSNCVGILVRENWDELYQNTKPETDPVRPKLRP